MGIADRIEEMQQAGAVKGCTVGRIVAELDTRDREAFQHAIRLIRDWPANRNQHSPLTAAQLHRAFRAEGHEVGIDGMQAHVYGRCSCDQ